MSVNLTNHNNINVDSERNEEYNVFKPLIPDNKSL